MFVNGVPLHKYKEAREIIVKLIRGEAVKKQGKPGLTRDKKARQHEILLYIAQLHGAGLGIYSGGNTSSRTTACDIAAEIHKLTARHIYEKIWQPNKDSDEVKQNIEIGKNNRWIADK